MKKHLFYTVLAVVFWGVSCAGQSTNIPNVSFVEWGGSVHGARLSIVVSNSVFLTNSEFVVHARMENLSTNILNMGLSSPEQDFDIWLRDNSGREYSLTRPYHGGMLTTDVLNPNESREWVIHLTFETYFPPPGFFPSKTSIPRGDYTLFVTRQFRWDKIMISKPIQANLLEVQIK